MGWFDRLKAGLGRTSERLSGGIADLFKGRRLDRDTLSELEDLLITSDMGVSTASRLTQALAKNRFDQEITADEVREILSTEIASILQPIAQPLEINTAHQPFIILVCGVNGSGKTTTIGKMAKQYRDQGHSVMLAAGVTFRAAAIEHLQIWGQRADCPVIAPAQRRESAPLAPHAIDRPPQPPRDPRRTAPPRP
ncbi:MAG: signal recognition particle receptor subunit alpha, partial [Alphaproteobacteria bacterium]|nr:signal recognition particle receptor subunit alpha [Alphaproteobacteria bacterium]